MDNSDLTPQLSDNDVADLSFGEILSKLQGIVKSIRGSSGRRELFKEACQNCKLLPATIPLNIAVLWNSTFRMLQHSIYMKRPIRRYIDELGEPFEHMVLLECDWQLAEVLLLFLFPFQRCTSRFECNRTTSEVDYFFFAYHTLYNHIDDVKDKLRSSIGLGALHYAPFMLKAIEAMETTLGKYYECTSFPTVYSDAMILNPGTKLSIFTEKS